MIGVNAQGVTTFLNISARLDYITRAICLCADGQEHLYAQMQQRQALINAKVKEWLAENADNCGQTLGDQQQERPTETTPGRLQKDWRQLKTALAIARAFPIHPSTDDMIDLYQRNKSLGSPDLKALLEKYSRQTLK